MDKRRKDDLPANKRKRGGRRKKDELPTNVRKRGKGFSYRYTIPITNPDGSKGRTQKDTPQYPTPEEAYKAGILIEAQLIDGTYFSADKTLFPNWSPTMLSYHAKLKKLRIGTVDSYTSLLVHANIFFKNKKIHQITPGDYQDFLFWLQDERDLEVSSITSVHAVVSSLFKHAVKRGQLASSPAAGATIPKPDEEIENLEGEEEVPKYLEKSQLATVMKAARDFAESAQTPREAFEWRQFSRVLFVLAHTGMRVGELGALEPARVNLSDLTIRIAATLYDKRGLKNYHLGPPKTTDSRRTIDISQRLASIIESQLKDLKTFRLMSGPKYYNKKEFVFVMPTVHLAGYPLRPIKINQMLSKALEAAGLPSKYITAHGLRHTFTSLSAEAGVTLDDICRQLGHASDKVTKKVYLHVTESRRKANVDKLDALLGDMW